MVAIPDTRDLELHLRFMGDWGVANFHRAAGWIAAGMRWRVKKGSTFTIHTMNGLDESLAAVLSGAVHMAVLTPIVTVDMCRRGRGLYDTPHPNLCAVAALPHKDRLMLAIGADVAERYGIRSYADIAAKRPPLRIATSINEAGNPIGLCIEQILAAYGIAWDDIERWGGRWIEVVRPPQALPLVASGEADAIFYEAIMTWRPLLRQRPMRFIPVDPPVLEDLHTRYGFLRADIEPGEFPGIDERIATVDFAQWLITVRDDLPFEVANLMARVIVENRGDFERQYRSTPPDESALSYPIRPEEVWKTEPVPLHPGAAAYYREIGVMPGD